MYHTIDPMGYISTNLILMACHFKLYWFLVALNISPSHVLRISSVSSRRVSTKSRLP